MVVCRKACSSSAAESWELWISQGAGRGRAGAAAVLAVRDDSQLSHRFSEGLWSHQHSWLPALTISNVAYRSSSINIISSYLFILMRSSVNTTEAVYVPWLGLKSSWVGLSAGARCCKSSFHLNLAQQLKAWKMKQYLVSALVTQPAVRHRDPSSLDQTATT